jgi:hypothetical protein
MAVTPSESPKNFGTRDHALPESETWPYHQPCRRRSKHEITHFLEAGHGHSTVSVAWKFLKHEITHVLRAGMTIALSVSPKGLELRDHVPTESGTWPWHRQHCQ